VEALQEPAQMPGLASNATASSHRHCAAGSHGYRMVLANATCLLVVLTTRACSKESMLVAHI